jgi:hypothetical protein
MSVQSVLETTEEAIPVEATVSETLHKLLLLKLKILAIL